MDQNFQTSFIPKKPIVEDRVVPSRPVNIFNVVGLFFLFAVLLSTGGIYFYKGSLEGGIEKMSNDLGLARNRFEPERLAQLQVLDKRLRAAKEILGNHVAVSPIFAALEQITLPSVRFTKFSYQLLPPRVGVTLEGIAVGYRSVALQSDIFLKNTNLIDPVFSNLVLDDRGNVRFELNFSVDPTLVDYEQLVETSASDNPDNL